MVATNNKIEVLEEPETAIVVRKHPAWLRYLLGSNIRPIPHTRQDSPEIHASVLSKAIFSWIEPLLRTGFDRVLEIGDIWMCPEEQRTSIRMEVVNSACSSFTARGRSYPEFWAILWTLRWWFVVQTFIEMIAFCLPVIASVLSRLLIEEIAYLYEGIYTSHGRAVGLLIGYLLMQFIMVHAQLGWQYMSIIRGEGVRSLLISKGQQKLFRLSAKGHRQYPASKVTSLLSTDTLRIKTAASSICHFASVLPVLVLAIGILVYNLGVAGLAGIALFIAFLLSTMLMGPGNAWLRKKSLPHADERIGVVQEAITNVRVIKFYGWEKPFSQLVSRARLVETWWLQKLNMMNSAISTLGVSSPTFSGMIAFVTRILIGHNLTPERAFPSLTLFELLSPVSTILTSGITQMSDGWNSIKRLSEFFDAPEMGPTFEVPSKGLSVRLKSASFQWDQDEDSTTEDEAVIEKTQNQSWIRSEPETSKFSGLRNVDLNIADGSLVMVVGAIGSGKSTLLKALTGQLDLTSGTAEVSHSLASCFTHWSMSGTVRSNIIFGRPFDSGLYSAVLQACNLEEDCSHLEKGDLTEVGERGVTLSGGQRARLALARCVYGNSSFFLLDDPLSAIDARVANSIFERCIRGLLQGTTRVMTTHNWQLLNYSDLIVWLDGYGGVHSGTLEELTENSLFMSQYFLSLKTGNSSGPTAITGNSKNLPPDTCHKAPKEISLLENLEKVTAQLDKDRNIGYTNGQEIVENERFDNENIDNEEILKDSSNLIEDEGRVRGTVHTKVLYDYFIGDSAQTTFLVFVSFTILIFSTGASAMTTVFLEFWTGHRFQLSQGVYAAIYCAVVALQALSLWIAETILCHFCLKVSSKLFDKAIQSVFFASMNWFDSNPIGRIVTRFTDDIANLDTTFIESFRDTLSIILNLIAQAVVTFVYMPWSALVLPPMLVMIAVLLSYYRPTTRELNRISQVLRSSAFTLLTESISGVDEITSFGQNVAWQLALDNKLDDMNYSYLLNFCTHYWIALRIYWCGLLLTIVALFLCLYRVFPLSPSAVGLLMSSIPNLVTQFTNVSPYLALLENNLNSIERLHELAYEIPQEAWIKEGEVGHTPQQPGWLTEGSIEFIDCSLKYRAGLPLALKHLNLIVKGGSKVGICGRSGSGKSTLISALFRIVELSTGRIEIDGRDIASLNINELREVFTIIPQEPILFKGTVRSNLDPFEVYSDMVLWEGLRRSGLLHNELRSSTSCVGQNHKFHLDAIVETGGANFSKGERQLLTLARALLRQSKILVLDEATSSVDMVTDQRIQRTIAKEFSQCTVLCIAHRLQTIVNYDAIIVIDDGQKVEMGSPLALFSSPVSAFGALCKDANISLADFVQ